MINTILTWLGWLISVGITSTIVTIWNEKRSNANEMKALKKALQIGLYHEIDNHHILEVKRVSGRPDYMLVGYLEKFYTENISNITKLLDENLVQELAFYYSKLKFVLEHQERLNGLYKQMEYLFSKMPRQPEETSKLIELENQREAEMHVLRITLAPVKKIKSELQAEFKKNFEEDPQKRTFIGVLSEDAEWFENEQLNPK